MDSIASNEISLRGEFTIFTANETKATILNAIRHSGHQEIQVDLSGVTEIDTSGIQIMLVAKKDAAANGKTLKFTHHSDEVLDLIDLCDLAGQLGDPLLIRKKS